MELTNNDLFYCYSKKLSDYIYKHSGIYPLTIAINPKSGRLFSLYARNDRLKKALSDYDKENTSG